MKRDHKFRVGTKVVGLRRSHYGKLVEQWTDTVVNVHKNGNIVLREYEHYSRKPKRWRAAFNGDVAYRCDDDTRGVWIAIETPELRAQIENDENHDARRREFSAIVDRLEMKARSGFSPTQKQLNHARDLCDLVGLPRIDK